MSCVSERSGWSRRPASRSLGCRCTRPVQRIAPRVGIVPDTLRGWCKQAAIDAGRRTRHPELGALVQNRLHSSRWRENRPSTEPGAAQPVGAGVVEALELRGVGVEDVGERIRPGRVAIRPGLLGGVGGRGGFGVA